MSEGTSVKNVAVPEAVSQKVPSLSRRNFLKGVAVGGLYLATGGLVMNTANPEWKESAASEGLKILLERESQKYNKISKEQRLQLGYTEAAKPNPNWEPLSQKIIKMIDYNKFLEGRNPTLTGAPYWKHHPDYQGFDVYLKKAPRIYEKMVQYNNTDKPNDDFYDLLELPESLQVILEKQGHVIERPVNAIIPGSGLERRVNEYLKRFDLHFDTITSWLKNYHLNEDPAKLKLIEDYIRNYDYEFHMLTAPLREPIEDVFMSYLQINKGNIMESLWDTIVSLKMCTRNAMTAERAALKDEYRGSYLGISEATTCVDTNGESVMSTTILSYQIRQLIRLNTDTYSMSGSFNDESLPMFRNSDEKTKQPDNNLYGLFGIVYHELSLAALLSAFPWQIVAYSVYGKQLADYGDQGPQKVAADLKAATSLDKLQKELEHYR